MSKKKISGLSKKVPTIFQGLPNIESVAEPKSEAKKDLGEQAAPLADLLSSSRKQRILFQVGESSLKAIVAKPKGKDWNFVHIEKYYYPVNEQGVQEMDIENFDKWLDGFMKEYARGDSYDAELLLRGNGVFLTEVNLPQVEEKDLLNSLIWEIAEISPFPVEEAKVLYKVRGEKVHVAAVQNSFLGPIIDSFHRQNIHPDVITLLPVAVEALNRHHPVFSNKNLLLLNLGGKKSELIVFRGGQFHSLREVAIGGNLITQAMMGTIVVEDKQIVINYQEAEELKEALGMPTPDLSLNPAEPKLSQISARIRPIFEKLINELRSSLLQFQRMEPNQQIEEIYLSGGGANYKGLEAYIFTHLQLPVQTLKPDEIHPKLDLSSVGLAGMAYVEEKELNFAPVEDFWKPTLEKYTDFARKGTFVSGILLVFLFVVSCIQLLFAQIHLHGYKARFRELGPTAQRVSEFEGILKKTEVRRMMLEKELPKEPHFGAILRELSQLVPPAVLFKSISATNKDGFNLNIEGIVESTNSSPDLVLSRFLEELNKSPFFMHSTLDSRKVTDDNKEITATFSIRTQLVVPR